LFSLSEKLFLFEKKTLFCKNMGGIIKNIIESKVAKGWVFVDEN
jgi:hypothetical protein